MLSAFYRAPAADRLNRGLTGVGSASLLFAQPLISSPERLLQRRQAMQ